MKLHLVLISRICSGIPIFHVSSLETYALSSIPYHIVPPLPRIEVFDGLEYQVATVSNSKVVHEKLYYILICLGYAHPIV